MRDRSTVHEMLDVLEERTAKKSGPTVIADCWMAYEENLEQIQRRGLHYIVAGRQPEPNDWHDEIENDDGWAEVAPTPLLRFLPT